MHHTTTNRRACPWRSWTRPSKSTATPSGPSPWRTRQVHPHLSVCLHPYTYRFVYLSVYVHGMHMYVYPSSMCVGRSTATPWGPSPWRTRCVHVFTSLRVCVLLCVHARCACMSVHTCLPESTSLSVCNHVPTFVRASGHLCPSPRAPLIDAHTHTRTLPLCVCTLSGGRGRGGATCTNTCVPTHLLTQTHTGDKSRVFQHPCDSFLTSQSSFD